MKPESKIEELRKNLNIGTEKELFKNLELNKDRMVRFITSIRIGTEPNRLKLVGSGYIREEWRDKCLISKRIAKII